MDMDGYIQNSLVESANQSDIVLFPGFSDINGLRTALILRIQAIRDGIGGKTSRISNTALRATSKNSGESNDESINSGKNFRFRCPAGAHAKCMNAIHGLSSRPSNKEKKENSDCKVCKADWLKKGKMCRLCKIGKQLEDLPPDRVTLLLLNILYSVLKGSLGMRILKSHPSGTTNIENRAKLFFELIQAEKKERVAAWRSWRVHLDLLNDLDELSQTKSTMRFPQENEDLTKLQKDELNGIVHPTDVLTCYNKHAAKQAMSLGDLRRAKETLRYLKNQSNELTSEGNDGCKESQCVLCLSEFGQSERAVLRCGHSFHMKPCLEGLIGRSSGWISCPMRCRIRTERKDVMIATQRCGEDESRSLRAVKGSWGTKVTRLVVDVLDIRDLGDKGVVFSQWDGMLDIVQLALAENGIKFVRATTLREIGVKTEAFFRNKDLTVLLLNVKNGAEGLTLLEATHVFMVEPLLNCGLDSQAINRVHRIGQNKKTYIHRYLVENTIEIKIDQLRAEQQAEDQQIEDAINGCKKTAINAGGIDGGFQSQQELLEMLQQ